MIANVSDEPLHEHRSLWDSAFVYPPWMEDGVKPAGEVKRERL